ncbi:MOSC domain-containing protein [Halostreptopolyspora alba]|uniref:MOSC domain-containing protein n=1 Tax=Halostreptopolyspora alba TaxID=2487137 RepID=A0A3N0EEL0_9ACTN|nr:MOSC domain-containing protein [Nocardiopsaceae bacterium YIM 96095]
MRSVNVGATVEAPWVERIGATAIDKRPVQDPTPVTQVGLTGDSQANRAAHGGRDQAVYAYAREDLDLWQERLDRPLDDGVFGENLTTVGLDVNEALIGERWRVGTAVLEVTLPRTPCGVFQAWLRESGWVKRFTDEARTGAYLRVLTEGTIAPGDEVTIDHRPDHGISVRAAFRSSYDRDVDLLRRIVRIPGRSDKWSDALARVEQQVSRG